MSMFVALNENKKLIHITEAMRGLACNCTCFECGETVLARKGEINEHHFAHASNKESCAINPESVLHKYAKEIIQESMGLQLPAVPNSDIEATWWTFDRIIPEFPLGLIRPDLVAYIEDEPIFIEIAVTHFIDQLKLNVIKSMNVKTVEIDLSSLLNAKITIPSDEAKKLVLESLECKEWLLPLKTQPVIVAEQKTIETPTTSLKQEVSLSNGSSKWQNYRFTINEMWLDVRKFESGMVSVKLAYNNFNPEIKNMLKDWSRGGKGSYNPKYKSWNYWLPYSEEIFAQLKEMNEA